MTRLASLLIAALLTLSAVSASVPSQASSPNQGDSVAVATAQAERAAADARQAAQTLEKWREQQSNFSTFWPTVPAFLALLFQGWRVRRDQKKQNQTAQAARVSTDAKLGEIHILVNGRLSAALQEVETLTAEVQRLREATEQKIAAA